MDSSPGSYANNIYSSGGDKLTEEQLYMSTSCQPGSRVIGDFSDVEKPFPFSVWRLKPPNQKYIYKKTFSTSEKVRISSRANRGKATLTKYK